VGSNVRTCSATHTIMGVSDIYIHDHSWIQAEGTKKHLRMLLPALQIGVAQEYLWRRQGNLPALSSLVIVPWTFYSTFLKKTARRITREHRDWDRRLNPLDAVYDYKKPYSRVLSDAPMTGPSNWNCCDWPPFALSPSRRQAPGNGLWRHAQIECRMQVTRDVFTRRVSVLP
jgi:hypothetical protein